eukprot:5488211-Amphidinium_carterae.6
MSRHENAMQSLSAHSTLSVDSDSSQNHGSNSAVNVTCMRTPRGNQHQPKGEFKSANEEPEKGQDNLKR